jgi:enamine deaminase RidA (YjgF/YER057c/UK114 family)
LQGPALDYGSSFSRAVEFSTPELRRLYVSGTASIRPDGRTAHPTDVRAQVELTMEVVEALLGSRGMTWKHCVRAIGYFKHMADAGAFEAWRAARGVGPLPVVLAKSDVCRNDLLFELELDAILPQVAS